MKIPEQDPRGLITAGIVIVVLAGVLTVMYVVLDTSIILPLIAVALVFGLWFLVAGVRRLRARPAVTRGGPPVTDTVPQSGPMASLEEQLPASTATGWHFVASADRSVIQACFEQFSVLAGPPAGYSALLDADADELAARANDKSAPGRGYAGFRRVGQGELTRVSIVELLRGMAGEAVHGQVHIAMAASDSPIMASSIYGEIYREAMAEGIDPFPMYSVQDHAVAAFVMACCRLIGGTNVRPRDDAEPAPLALATAQVGEPATEVPPPAARPIVRPQQDTGLHGSRGVTVTGGAAAARALADASYDAADADGVIIGHPLGVEPPPTVVAQGRLTCPGCGREISFHALVTPGYMGDGDTSVCDVCHSRVALSYYPLTGTDDGTVLLVAHTLVSPSQRQSVRIVSLSAAPGAPAG